MKGSNTAPQNISFRPRSENADLVQRVDRMAGILDRPRNWVIERAIIEYLEREKQQLLKAL